MTRRTRDEALRDKRAAVRAADASGDAADSMAVRMAIVARMNAGEITLEDAQAELKRIKAGASKVGKTTRSRAWRDG